MIDGRVSRRICAGQNMKLQNNVSIDTVDFEGIYSDCDGVDGKSIAANAFNQYYFENSLNWDFTKVWAWDNKRNVPMLRNVGLNSVNPTGSKQNESKLVDVLSSQLKTNVWLLGA